VQETCLRFYAAALQLGVGTKTMQVMFPILGIVGFGYSLH